MLVSKSTTLSSSTSWTQRSLRSNNSSMRKLSLNTWATPNFFLLTPSNGIYDKTVTLLSTSHNRYLLTTPPPELESKAETTSHSLFPTILVDPFPPYLIQTRTTRTCQNANTHTTLSSFWSYDINHPQRRYCPIIPCVLPGTTKPLRLQSCNICPQISCQNILFWFILSFWCAQIH